MKIGILTQPLHANYGGLLQNFALQQVLIRAGHEVNTIDWDVVKGIHVQMYQIKMRILSILFPSKYPKVKYQPNENEQYIIRRNTNYFISSYISHTKVVHSRKEFELQSLKDNYNAYVVGSDQCWRPSYNMFLSSMFLDFAKYQNVKRIAYAASFGTDQWEFTPQQIAICTPLVQLFDLVTVREDSGMKLCKKYFGVDAIHVLDPTMLLTKEDYISLIKVEKEPQSAGSLFNYILDPDVKKSAFIQRVADVKGLRSFQVLPKYQAEIRTKEDVKKRIEDCIFPRVTTWLRAFMDAEMTIVDSFHGMVFSIIFNKPFWVIGNASRGMSRFTSLLKVFSLEDRLLDVNNLKNIDVSKPINWESINGILEEKRIECKALLLNKLSE